ncbi:hypothetical protein IJU97_04055 [bacterium]|nr:hypothetical protein [bacterium]
MPLKSDDMKEVKFNETLITLYLEGAVASYFQDLNPLDTKLNIKSSQIINKFKAFF